MVPCAAMLALGAVGSPRARSSAVTSPGADPRMDNMLFSCASVERAVAAPLNRPEACMVPRNELAMTLRSVTPSVQRASNDLTTAPSPDAPLPAGAAAEPGRSALPLALKLHALPARRRRSTVRAESESAPDNASVR